MVLLVYISLAILHTLYLLRYGESSTAWDSITELLTLTLNSRPPLGDLENTSAGIYCLKTFGKLFVIRSTAVEPDGSSTEDEGEKLTNEKPARHVELILRDVARPTDSKADHNPASQGKERISRRRHSLLPTFARPFAPYRAPYPDHQHELHWGPGLSPSQDSVVTSSSKQPLLTQEQSSSSSTSPSSSSSGRRHYRRRNRMLGCTEHDGELFEKIVPNQPYA